MITTVFILKIGCGLLLWAIYTFYYTDRATADIYKYFDDSKVMYDALKTKPSHYFKMLFGIGNNTPEFNTYYNQMNYWSRKYNGGGYNDSHTIVRLNAIMRIFSLGYYNVHTVFICFLSLIGLTAIYKTFVKYLTDKTTELLVIVFFLPSVIFWGSGVLKEGFILFSLGMLIFVIQQKLSIKMVVILIIAIMLLALSKFYLWLAILPSLLFLFWIKNTSIKRVWLKFFIVISVFAVIGLNVDRFTNLQNPLVTLSQKQLDFNKLASGELVDTNNKPIPPANSAIHINELKPTIASFIKNSPQAFLTVLLRPYLWEANSPFLLLAALENALIVLFISFCLIFMRPLNSIRWEYVLLCLSFVIIQFVIIGEITPIMGAIVRYKVPTMPFLLIAFLYMLDKDKIRNYFPLLNSV
ncbi:MAG: hypothetical protein ABI315_08365 [Bacteroidia bacterium]